MALSLTDLITALTPDDVKNFIFSVAKKVGLSTETWEEGDPTLTIVDAVSQKVSDWTQVLVLAVGGGFLDYAVRGWLTLLAKNVYNVDRIESTFASGEVVLSNAGGGLYTINEGDLTFLCPATGKTYRNTNASPLTLAVGPGTTLRVPIAADEKGTASNAAIGQVSTLVTTLLGVTCSNDKAIYGTDEEKDESLRIRCRLKLGALTSLGLAAGYEYWARSSRRPDGTPITVNRARVYRDPIVAGQVDVLVAGEAGAVDSGDVTILADVIAKLATPLAITSVVASAVNHSIDVTYELWIYDTAFVDSAAAEAAALKALDAYMKRSPIGGYVIPATAGMVYTASLIGQIEGISTETIKAAVTVPAGAGVTIATDEVPVLGTVTATIHLVTR